MPCPLMCGLGCASFDFMLLRIERYGIFCLTVNDDPSPVFNNDNLQSF